MINGCRFLMIASSQETNVYDLYARYKLLELLRPRLRGMPSVLQDASFAAPSFLCANAS